MTGNQLERFARAHRQVSRADDAAVRIRRRLAWRFEDDGSLAGTFRLPPLPGAVLLWALRAAAGDLEHPHGGDGSGDGSVSAGTAGGDGGPAGTAGGDKGDKPAVRTSSSLADALLVIAEAFLAGKAAGADDPGVYQVIVHAGAGALAQDDPDGGAGGQPGGTPAGVSAETPAPSRPVPGDPAGPARCHVDDGPAVSVRTAQMLGCTAADCHDAGITPETIIPPWYGERLDLDHAIYTCFANARPPQERQEQRDQAHDPGLSQPSKWVVEPADWIRYIREHTAA